MEFLEETMEKYGKAYLKVLGVTMFLFVIFNIFGNLFINTDINNILIYTIYILLGVAMPLIMAVCYFIIYCIYMIISVELNQ